MTAHRYECDICEEPRYKAQILKCVNCPTFIGYCCSKDRMFKVENDLMLKYLCKKCYFEYGKNNNDTKKKLFNYEDDKVKIKDVVAKNVKVIHVKNPNDEMFKNFFK